ncbi:uncharacterized protein Z518_00433 [Rhinocladiella mackenziei CBS 650.93]|uniref:Alpha-methylacyl-CoA racemase n=1 Tax=Rhinocladiella mackenziei CBS 650.93 TaxID=1442369 RepID=A0A0D2ITF6_9EURO|nr:uncharacterized protein Z518_00433 [Rhinocladiella mackenziei CBS 650.93]KIX09354.1 hypothetical protein Z518_00433 [Rhinocladiella mackenziei CBS 650.93]
MDISTEPFRPGVLERLDLDPETMLLNLNPRLIVVRLTGFQRDGEYEGMAGHDINYLAVSGILSMLGGCDQLLSPPMNLLADFAGGGLVAFTGALLALIQRSLNGKGHVVNANMAGGVSHTGKLARLSARTRRCYEYKDGGKYLAVDTLEPQF